jgi:hypothetical protein
VVVDGITGQQVADKVIIERETEIGRWPIIGLRSVKIETVRKNVDPIVLDIKMSSRDTLIFHCGGYGTTQVQLHGDSVWVVAPTPIKPPASNLIDALIQAHEFDEKLAKVVAVSPSHTVRIPMYNEPN